MKKGLDLGKFIDDKSRMNYSRNDTWVCFWLTSKLIRLCLNVTWYCNREKAGLNRRGPVEK